MPSWNRLFEDVQPLNTIANKKKEYFDRLTNYTKRNCIVYYSCWQQKPGINGDYSITDDDRNGFMNALYGLDANKGLDLVIHTPGGNGDATQSIVNYLYLFFKGDIRIIVPHTAMSAGTMIACSGRKIVMAKHSNLGPIDPQINGMPANEFLDLLEKAKEDISKNQNIVYWQMTLSNYPPTFFGICENAIKSSKKMVKEWLKREMLKDKSDEEIDSTVEYLADYHTHLQHNDRLSIDDLKKNTSLKIMELESDQELQEDVLSLYHCYQISATMSNCCKIIENHNLVSFVKKHI